MGELNYGRMMHRAMQGLVAEALEVVADQGLPGDHHFYISFRTDHAGVDIPDWLREQFPQEMMIVLQHEFSDLAVMRDRFSVRLSFQDRPAMLVVPFDAILQFADPSASFGLQFNQTDLEDEQLEQESLEEAARAIEAVPREHRSGGDEDRPPGEVVDLDKFRKK